MSVVVNEVRKGAYFDSVALMRMGLEIKKLPGIEEAGLMVATPANREILREAGVLAAEGEAAGAGDLVLALRARTQAEAEAGLVVARGLLDAKRAGATAGESKAWRPRTLRSALDTLPDANLALISVPGDFAAAEGLKALQRGLNVMIFSDNVPLADEVELKLEAQRRGLLVMGPDCGTAIIGGVPLAFANAVPKGDIGIIGASGTGIQEVSCLIARADGGHGVSHAIGTGGRDLKAEVGAITTLMAFDLLEQDAATRTIVVISKPPAEAVARKVIERAERSAKPVVLCFLGSPALKLSANVRQAHTLQQAAMLAMGKDGGRRDDVTALLSWGKRGQICGLFAGGTLCSEAQILLAGLGLALRSNVPVPGASAYAPDMGDMGAAHTLIDLGDDFFTRGRPHPMIEPAVRNAALLEACRDPRIDTILLDVVLGFGAHADPAGHIVRVLQDAARKPGKIVASVTGTEQDPQVYSRQVRLLRNAGIYVCASNAEAAQTAFIVPRGAA